MNVDFSELFSSPQAIVAQCFGFGAMLIAFVIYAFRDRRKILFSKMIADALWVVHYALLGGYSGAIINCVNVVREGVFYHKDQKWAQHPLWPLLFVGANIVSVCLTWAGTISLLPLFGSCINVLALWCTNTVHLRWLSLPALTAWLIYAILIGSLSSTLVNAISIGSILFSFVRDFVADARKKQPK